MDSKCLHMRYAADVQNLLVTNDLKDGNDLVAKIRSAMMFVRFLLTRPDKFKVAMRVAGTEFKIGLCLDILIR